MKKITYKINSNITINKIVKELICLTDLTEFKLPHKIKLMFEILISKTKSLVLKKIATLYCKTVLI